MNSRSFVTLSSSALRSNFRILAKKVPHLPLLPMIKADAYGHDAAFTARTLLHEKSLFGFGVATFAEAIGVRKALQGNAIPILVFSDCSPWTDEKRDLCIRYRLEPVLSEFTSLLQFQNDRGSSRLPAHVEFNTGMNRLGIPMETFSWIRFYPRSVFTHLADAESPKSKLTRMQISNFRELSIQVKERFPKALLHFANSATLWNHSHYSLLKEMSFSRPGLSLYGIRPFGKAKADGLKRVMHFYSRVLNRIHLEPGDRVGYGGVYECKKPSGEWISIVGAGYADGVFRSLSNEGVAYHGAKKLRFKGRVSMDLSAIEGHSKIKIGDALEIWGDRVDPYEQSGLAGTIPYEMTTRIGSRVERNYE